MKLNFKQFAALYGLRPTPTVVTDTALDVKFVNHEAALLSVVQLGGDFIKKSLTPASMQRVRRCLHTRMPVVFTQFFGQEYRRKFQVKVQWDQNDYIVFSFYNPHGYRDETPMTATLSEGNMCAALEDIRALAAQAVTDPKMSVGDLAKQVDKAALCAFRRARQEWQRYQEPECYAFHMPTLLAVALEPCNPLLEKQGSSRRIRYSEPTGEKMVKCDGNLLCYVIYTLLSTILSEGQGDVTVQYMEYPDYVKIHLFGGKERPLMLSGFVKGQSRAICDSLSLSSSYHLIEKMQGELNADYLEDEELVFSLTLPVSHADGGFREYVRRYLTERDESLEIEFSIL